MLLSPLRHNYFAYRARMMRRCFDIIAAGAIATPSLDAALPLRHDAARFDICLLTRRCATNMLRARRMRRCYHYAAAATVMIRAAPLRVVYHYNIRVTRHTRCFAPLMMLEERDTHDATISNDQTIAIDHALPRMRADTLCRYLLRRRYEICCRHDADAYARALLFDTLLR